MKTFYRIISFLFLCALFSILLPVTANAQISDETARLLRAARIQVPAQRTVPADFTLQLLNGQSVTLSSLKGKVVMLNFWATWCPPCREEMPSMENLYQRYKDSEFEMLAVNLRENNRTIRQFVQRHSYTFPVPLDTDGRVGSLYGIASIPTTLIIDKDGMIIGRVVGSIQWDTPQVFAAFDALIR